MIKSIKELEEFDKFVNNLKRKKKSNLDDVDELVSKLNSLDRITFCNFALNRNIIVALLKDKDNSFVPFAFKVKYQKGKHLDVYTSEKDTGFRNNKHLISELGAITTILNSIQDLKIYDTTLGLPDYYYHVNTNDNKESSIIFGWDLKKKKIKSIN